MEQQEVEMEIEKEKFTWGKFLTFYIIQNEDR